MKSIPAPFSLTSDVTSFSFSVTVTTPVVLVLLASKFSPVQTYGVATISFI
jgi:hypothetical protein